MNTFFKILFGTRPIKRRYHRKKVAPHDREAARTLVHARLAHFNQFYNFSYNKVFIKNQRTRWGSCSSNRNLNFNWKIITLSPEAQDYLIVHELCHLREFNHGQAFWDLVALQIPDYKRIRTTMRHVD
ncbi:MAG: M48 family metallopeptidase [Candidatus Pacebacteria bacterium]|jgi:predicted metal-dependent hydrolase|nr:M48 family metallopeptidase [Candidatus Paceibacterota bacterium]MBP9701238.1 M48 family metallopeptidase [Candidatus Paceibacterota bacterium]